jgi:hypothetical protein
MNWWGDDDNDDEMRNVQLTSVAGRDPETERRQIDFWNQAQNYAAKSPFQAQYGGPSAMPGMGAMSQQGQQYLTNQILGSGAYGRGWVNPNDPTATRQNLGFTDYTGPEEGTGYGQRWPSPAWGYEVNEEPFRTGRTAVRKPGLGPPDPGDPTDPPDPPIFPGSTRTGYNTYTGGASNILGAAPGGRNIIGAQFGMGAPASAQAQGGLLGSRAEEEARRAARPYSPTVGVRGIEEAGDVTRRMLREPGSTGDPGYNQFIGADGWQGISAPGYNQFLGGDWQGISPAAGVNQFLGAGGWQGLAPAGTGTAPGDPSIGAAGDFAVPTADQLEIGGTDADFDFGVAGDQDMDALTPWQRRNEAGELIGEAGYAPDYTEVGAGDVTGAATDLRYTDPTTGELYEGWGEKALGVTDPTAITDILGTQATGKAFREGWGIKDPTIGGTDWTGTTPWDEAVEAGEVDVSGITTPTLTDAERITGEEIGAADTAGFAVTPAAVAGLDKIVGPTDVTVDPLYKDWTAEQLGTAETAGITDATRLGVGGQDAFTGASFLGGDLGGYMDVGGVESQVSAAERDYQIAQNQEQARRAASHAWGTRGDIPRAEQEQQKLARIADIRRKGYTDAADRMEADLQREQAAGMQAQQLGTQGALQAQQLEAQRVGDRAARAQQAGLAQQQLGAQAGMQTQQLTQQGGIRGAELGMQAGLQAQQLEAQRMEANAARRQQAALAGQQLGGQYGLQTQALGQQAAMRNAEMEMQAAMANQQAALQTGTQSQQLEAQRQIEQARLKLQGQQQTQQLGVQTGLAAQGLEAQRAESQAGRAQQAAMAQYQGGLEGAMQTQRLGVGVDQRQAELGMQAALANQQAQLQTGGQQAELEARRRESSAQLGQQAQIQTAQNELQAAMADQQAALSSGNQTAQLEAQRKIREAELQLQRGMQTQQLGAGSAEQQTQNEYARRQALAGMGQDAATQQTQNEYARRQQLAQMGLTSAQQQSQNEFLRRQDLSRMGLQAQGMGMDDQARFRQQQMQAAQQLAGIGGMEQGAAFGAAGQLGQMGAAQEQAQRMQQAYAYEQWLRGIEGGSEGLSLLQAMQPGGQQWGYQRKPSVTGQIIGGLAQLGGTAAAMGQAGIFGSDVRLKENIELVGSDNGFNLYEFNYRNQDARWRGVMAQEVMVTRPDAVGMREGVLVVDYDALGMRMEAV